MAMVEQREPLSYPDLLRVALDQLLGLLRVDARLAQLEMKEKASAVVRAGALIGGAAILVLLGCFSLIQGLIVLLIHLGVAAVVSPFVVAALFFVLAVVLYFAGRSILADWTPLPTKAISNVHKDFEAVKEGVAHVPQ
jgi:hypothetical protein